jgi:hypothetical protein
VTVPVLTFVAPDDAVVDPEVTRARMRTFPHLASSIVEVTDSDHAEHHVLAGDVLSPSTTGAVAKTIVSFLASLATGR